MKRNYGNNWKIHETQLRIFVVVNISSVNFSFKLGKEWFHLTLYLQFACNHCIMTMFQLIHCIINGINYRMFNGIYQSLQILGRDVFGSTCGDIQHLWQELVVIPYLHDCHLTYCSSLWSWSSSYFILLFLPCENCHHYWTFRVTTIFPFAHPILLNFIIIHFSLPPTGIMDLRILQSLLNIRDSKLSRMWLIVHLCLLRHYWLH